MTSTVSLYLDVGFTEDSVEVPKVGRTLPDPIGTYDVSSITKDRLFSSFRVKAQYSDIQNTTYLAIQFPFSDITFYGWVDDVSLLSIDNPLCEVSWHVDLWRTYLSYCTFGSARVLNRPYSDTLPPQPYPARYRTAVIRDSLGEFLKIATAIGDRDIWWCYCYLTSVDSSAKTTGLRTVFFPVASRPSGQVHYALRFSGADKNCPMISDLIKGTLDETLGIDPSSIISVFLSPQSPRSGITVDSGTVNIPEGTPSTFSLLTMNTATVGHITDPAFFSPITYTLSTPRATTDQETYTVTDMSGDTVYTLPWGITTSSYTVRTVLTSSGGWVEIRFGAFQAPSGFESTSEGMTARVPLPTLDIGSNAYSSYTYSGMRDYEIQQRDIESKQRMYNGLASSATSAFSGGLVGGLVGKGTSTAGGSAGMIGVGAVLGAASQAVTSLTSRAMDDYMAPIIQGNRDTYMSRQTSGLVLSGSGLDCLINGFSGLALTALVMDVYSQTQRSRYFSLYGATVDEPTPDVTTLLSTGGPLRMVDLVVGGSVPNHAKSYIRTRLEQGVRLI